MVNLIRFTLTAAIASAVLGWPNVAAQSTNHELQLDNASRRFRIATYRHFRDDRKTYDRRVRGSLALIDRWKSRGAAASEALELIDWFNRAIVATDAGQALSALPYQVSELGDAAKLRHETPTVAEEPLSRDTSSEAQVATRSATAPDELTVSSPRIPGLPLPPLPKAMRPLPATVPSLTRVEVKLPATPVLNGVEVFAKAGTAAPRMTRTSAATKNAGSAAQGKPATVNATQLAQRLKEHNRSIRQIEKELQEQLSVERLERKVQELEDLKSRREVWQLYANILDERARRQLGIVESFETCLDLVKLRRFELQIDSDTEPSSKNSDLSQRLHAIDERVKRWRTQ